MSNFDERIRKSLSAEDQAFLAELDTDRPLYREITATFQGRMRWLTALGWVMGFVLFLVAAYCGWRAWHEPDLRDMLGWGAGCAVAVSGVALIKIWFWLELKTNTIVREIKRLEIQVAGLAATARADAAR